MRLILSLLLVIFSANLFAQESNNSLRTVDSIATTYLDLMYVKHDFEAAKKMWDTTRIKQSLERTYDIQGNKYPLRSIETLKEYYASYFQNVRNYKQIGSLVIGEVKKENKLQQCFISYEYNEFNKGIETKGQSILILFSNDYGKNWIIHDSRIIK